MIKINKNSAEMSFLYGICILTCSNSFKYMLFGLFTVLQRCDTIFSNNPGLYFNNNQLTKISLPFILIYNGIVHHLVPLGPEFANSGILDSISKIKNYQNNFERSKIEIFQTKVFWNIESKYAPPNDVIF